MKEKIELRTSSVKVSRKRPPDPDHAHQIFDLTRRGYIVTVLSDSSPWWNMSIYRADGPIFVNQPEGTDDVLMVHTYFNGDDARLTDRPWPGWISDLVKHINRIAPSNVYVRTGWTDSGVPDGTDPQDSQAG